MRRRVCTQVVEGARPASQSRSRKLPASAALLGLFVFAVSVNAMPAALLRAADEFEVGIGAMAQATAVQFAGFVVAAIVGGVLSDRLGKKHLLQAACVLLLVGAIIVSVAPGLRHAFLGAGLMGIGGGALECLSTTLLSDLFSDRRKFFLNLSQVVFCTGAVSGPFLMGLVLPVGVSWRYFFGGIAAMGAVLFVLFSVSQIPRPPHEERIHFDALVRIVRRPALMLSCAALFGYVLTESAIVIYSNAYLQTEHQAPERWAIYSLSLFWFSMGIGRFLCALIPERIAYRPVIVGLLFLTTVTLVLQNWASGWVASLVLFALSGLACSGIWPLIIGMTASVHAGYSGTVLGITIAVGALGCVVAPTVMNTFFSHLPPVAVYPAASLPLVFSLVFILWLKPSRQRSRTPSVTS
jgi:MFS family permease